MRLNEIAKGLVIAAPMFVLAACGSTSTTEADTQQQVNQVVEEVVQTNSVEKVLSPAEKQRLELEALRQEHIIYFDFDTSTVSSEFATLLDAHATYLRANPSTSVLVEGHADERGTPEYNIALGERRAKAVSRYLTGLGVNDGQIETVSYGEEKPLDNSRSESGFEKNRRAVLVY
ncbi:MAG: peptidoglycan-associated lipoprotein Pal [Gammaproteobacteria bacterium]|nr:peptidoglycan-associated lipoprotein Pal [Gammaproteobacteria bacterium]